MGLLPLLLLLPSLLATAQADNFTPSLLINSDPVASYGIHDISLTYHLSDQNVNANFDTFDSATNALSIFTNSVDAAVISQPLTAAQRARYPTVSAFPFLATAIVPIYRVDALASDAPIIVFTRAILVGIFSGTIRRWNDPQLVAANPATMLPNASIIIILPSVTRDHELSLCFTSALSSFNSLNALNMTTLPFSPSTTPTWPLSLYADYHIVDEERIDALASYVTTNDNTISFTTLATALSIGVTVGDMVNLAGNVVVASNISVNYAVVELGAHSLQTSSSSVDDMDLNDAIGPLAWPICLASFFLIDLEQTRSTCASRVAMIQFLYFIYDSALADSIFAAHQYATMPDIVVQALSIRQRLVTSILCHGDPAMPSGASRDIAFYGTSYMTFMLSLLTFVYNQLDTDISYRFMPTRSRVAFEQLLAGEADMIAFYPSDVDPSEMADALASPSFMITPLLLTSVAVTFNLRITSTVDLTGTPVRLSIDMPTFLFVLTRRITDWRHPSILARNPQLAELFPPASNASTTAAAPITPVHCCGVRCTLTSHLVGVFTRYANQYNQSLLQYVTELSQMNTKYGMQNCVKQKRVGGIYWAPNELVMESMIDIVTGALGFVKDVQPNGDIPNQMSIWYPRPTSLSSQYYLTYSSPPTLQACLDVFDYGALTVDPSRSENINCWPLAQVLYVGLRLSYSTSGTAATSCTRGIKTVNMMRWLVTVDGLSATTEAQNVLRTSIVTPIKQVLVDKLNTSTCDGQTMLYVEPVVWQLTGGISSFAYVAGAIGISYCVVSLMIVASHYKHTVIRSSSPIFLAMSLGGLLLFFVSTLLWVVEPSKATCSAFAWSLDLGFFLTFAPLFAKTWRIYRIFGGKKLKVVKITNARLAAAIVFAFAFEVVVLAAWQATAPIYPALTIQLSPITPVMGGSFQQHHYTQCGVDAGTGKSFLEFLLISKAILLLFGSMMAFSTRKVKSTFNESQPIAWSIYNVCFSAGIVLPMMVLLNQIGDVLTILLLFLLLWIGFFTMIILTASKFAIVLHLVKTENVVEQMAGLSQSSTGQFSFISFANITSSTSMRAYVRSLEDHLLAAKQHLTKLLGKEGGGGGDTSRFESRIGGGRPSSVRSVAGALVAVSRMKSAQQDPPVSEIGMDSIGDGKHPKSPIGPSTHRARSVVSSAHIAPGPGNGGQGGGASSAGPSAGVATGGGRPAAGSTITMTAPSQRPSAPIRTGTTGSSRQHSNSISTESSAMAESS